MKINDARANQIRDENEILLARAKSGAYVDRRRYHQAAHHIDNLLDDRDEQNERIRQLEALLATSNLPAATETLSWHPEKPENPEELDAYTEVEEYTGRRRAMVWKGGQWNEIV
jgi:hypothetical protein